MVSVRLGCVPNFRKHVVRKQTHVSNIISKKRIPAMVKKDLSKFKNKPLLNSKSHLPSNLDSVVRARTELNHMFSMLPVGNEKQWGRFGEIMHRVLNYPKDAVEEAMAKIIRTEYLSEDFIRGLIKHGF